MYYNRYFFGHLTVFLTINLLGFLTYQNMQSEVRAKEVMAQSTMLSKDLYDAGIALAVYSVTKSKILAERSNKLSGQIPETLQKLHKLIDERTPSASIFTTIKQTTEKGMSELSADKHIVENAQFNLLGDDRMQTLQAFKHIKQIADELEQQLDQLVAEEQKTADQASQLKTFFVILLLFVSFAYAAYNYMVQAKYSRRQSI